MMFRNTTTWIALTQTLMVVLGFFGLAVVLKLAGYPHSPFRWNTLAVFLRHYGIWFLLIPILWKVAVTMLPRQHQSEATDDVIHLFGVGIGMAILALFLYGAAFPYTIPMYIHMR